MSRYYPNKKTTVEDCKNIAVSTFKAKGFFTEGRIINGTSRWLSGDEEIGSISFQVNMLQKEIYFHYKTRADSFEEWKHKNYAIKLCTTACHFGGVRYWFECYYCHKKTGKLYIEYENNFACRTCLNLTYESRNEGKLISGLSQLFKYGELQEKYSKLRTKSYKGKLTKNAMKITQSLEKTIYHIGSFNSKYSKKLDFI